MSLISIYCDAAAAAFPSVFPCPPGLAFLSFFGYQDFGKI
jgi:hypothetical protein